MRRLCLWIDLLVEDIATSILVVLTPLHNLTPDIPHSDSGIILQLGPSLLWPLVLAITSRREVIELSKHPASLLEVATQAFRFLGGRAGGRDGTDERDGVAVDREIVVEGIIEEREKVRDLRVDFKQTPKG